MAIIRSRAAGLALLLLIAGSGACRTGHAASPDRFQGVIEYEERAFGFELGGRLDAVAARVGDRVSSGAELARLDPTLDALALEARRADIAAAEAQVALLRAGARSTDLRAVASQLSAAREREATESRNLERQRALLEGGAVGSAFVDEADARLTQARAQRSTLEAQLQTLRNGARSEELAMAEARVEAARVASRIAEERLARHRLRSPSEGTVLGVHFDPGEVVAPGAPIVTIADLQHPYVDVFVPEGRVSSLRVGQPARVVIDGTPETFNGTVERLAARTEFTPRFLFSERERPNLVLRVRIRLDDPKGALHAGIPAFATIGAR